MLMYDGAPLVISIFVEDHGVTLRDVDRADSVIPEIIGIYGRPLAGNGKGSTTIAVVLEDRDGRGREILTTSTAAGATDMWCYRIDRHRVIGIPDVGVYRSMVTVSNGDEPDRRDAIVPIPILAAGPSALHHQIPSSETTVFEEVSFVATRHDDGVDSIVPIVIRIVYGPVGVDIQSFTLEI